MLRISMIIALLAFATVPAYAQYDRDRAQECWNPHAGHFEGCAPAKSRTTWTSRVADRWATTAPATATCRESAGIRARAISRGCAPAKSRTTWTSRVANRWATTAPATVMCRESAGIRARAISRTCVRASGRTTWTSRDVALAEAERRVKRHAHERHDQRCRSKHSVTAQKRDIGVVRIGRCCRRCALRPDRFLRE